MSDVEDTRRLVLAIMDFLQTELATREDLSLEDRDGLEMAIECLEMAYDLENHEHIQRRPLLDMFAQASNPVSVRDKLQADELKNEGNNKMTQKLYREADEDYSRAIELDKWNPIYYCNRAGARTKLERYFEAIADCRQAITLNPDYSKAFARMGEAYALLERPRRAVRCFRQALDREPDNERYQNNLRLAESQAAEVAGNGIDNLLMSILASMMGVGLPQPGNGGGFPLQGNGGGFPQSGSDGGFPQPGNDGGFPQPGNDGGFPQPGNGGSFPQPGNGGLLSMALPPSAFMIITDPHSSQECDARRNSSLATITEEGEQHVLSGRENENGQSENSNEPQSNEGNLDTPSDDTIHIRVMVGIPVFRRMGDPNEPPEGIQNQMFPFGGLGSRNAVETENNRNGYPETDQVVLGGNVAENNSTTTNQNAPNFTYGQETRQSKDDIGNTNVNITKANGKPAPNGLFKEMNANNVTAQPNGGEQQSSKEKEDSTQAKSKLGTVEESSEERPEEQQSESQSPAFNMKDISNFFKNLGKTDSSKTNGKGEKDQVKEDQSKQTDNKAEAVNENERTKNNSTDPPQGLFSFFNRQKTSNSNNDKSVSSETNGSNTFDKTEDTAQKTEKEAKNEREKKDSSDQGKKSS